MKKALVLLLVVAFVAAGWFLFSEKLPVRPKAESAIPERFVAKAEKRDIKFTVELSGDVTPAFQLEVRPEVGGKVNSLPVEPGQQVQKGDLLCEIDDTDLLTEKASALTEIEGARLAVDKSSRNLQRSKELFEAKLISREVFDNLNTDYLVAQNSLVKAERKLQLVEDRLRKTKILSPSDGTILKVDVIEGQVVTAAASVNSGTSLMVIANLSKLLIDTHVNQMDVGNLKQDQRVQLRVESLKDVPMEAQISFMAPIATVKNNVKGFQVEALIENPHPGLRPGMTVSLTVPVATAEEAVSVPISAVFSDGPDENVVYVRNGGGTEKRSVKIGVTNYDFAEVKSGLKVGEEILLIDPASLSTAS